MTAFKDQWQEQRRLRQEEVALRKQQVRDILTSFEQNRQEMASQLRDDLSLFQLELQHETQEFLANASQQRQAQAEQITQLLRNFVQILQYQTAEFLAASAADRSLMAQQLFQELSQFHTHLMTSVATLRQTLQARMQEIQAEVQMLQAETQETLIVNREQRLLMKAQLIEELTTFVEGVRVDVQNYLSELEVVRHDRAQQLYQMLQLDRDRRLNEVDVMFQELAEFRAELRQYCTHLRSLVWGSGEAQPEAIKPQAAQPKVQVRPQPKVAPVAPAPKATLNKAPMAKPAPVAKTISPQPVAKVPVASVPTPQPVAPTPQPVSVQSTPMAIAPEAITLVETPVETPMVAQPEVLTVVPTPQPKPVQLDPAELEKEIFNHIHQVQGARLTEIESALGINRFQAVDALRSLIKKGLITQRDRIYLIQEEVSL